MNHLAVIALWSGAFLLLVAFYLWRRHHRGVARAPMPEPSADTMLPRVSGERIYNGRYILTEVVSSEAEVNIYEAQDTIAVRVCPTCGARLPDQHDRFCPNCGTDLSNVTAIHLVVWIRETKDAAVYAALTPLLEMRLNHPALLLPVDVFSAQVHGEDRYYEVYTGNYPTPLSLRPMPQPPQKVLAWTISLAKGLAYLHRHHVALNGVRLDNVTIAGECARWIQLREAQILSPEAQEGEVFAQEVASLIKILLYLLTGADDSSAVTLPPTLASCCSQVLAASDVTAESLAEVLQNTLAQLGASRDSLIFDIGLRSDVGMKRTLNEDSVLVLSQTAIVRSRSNPVGIFAVADGMGGHEAGEVASELTVQVIGQSALRGVFAPLWAGESPDFRQWIVQAALKANEAVLAQRQTVGNDMGCTLVLAAISGRRVVIANVGDSRAYHLSAAGIRQVTTDHSWVERLIATGQITREESRHHPQKNIIYRVIGDHQPLSVDVFEESLSTGEAVLLCSDGLSGMVEDRRIWDLWKRAGSAQDACERLVAEANQAGGEDNISVILVQLKG